MSVEYEVVSKANPQNRDEIKYYPRIIHKGIIGRDVLEEALVRETSLSRGDARSLLTTFQDIIHDNLSKGFKVRLEDVGLLFLRTKSNGSANAADVNAKNFERVSIGFKGDGELMEKLAKIKFEKSKEKGA